MSDLSMRLGENATPMVGEIRAKLFPDGERTDSRVIEMYFLNDDIDSDMWDKLTLTLELMSIFFER